MRKLMLLGLVLMAASCTSGKTAPSCPPGQSLCGGACVVTAYDPANCGACGKTCGAGEICSQGACTIACQAGFINCGGRCVDPMVDAEYCGASADCTGAHVGTACVGNQVCRQGACTVSCPAGFVDCGGSCIDPMTTAAYCGAAADCTGPNAGTACGPKELCRNSTCLSNDASLSGLTLSHGTLGPTFDPGSLLYVTTVGDAFDTVTVTPTAASPDATITVDGTTVASGTASPPIALAAGTQTAIHVVVSAPGGASESYGVVVTRRSMHYLKASNTAQGSLFGLAVSLDGDTLVVGAPGESSNATGVNGNQADSSASSAGAAYVFVRDATGRWSQQAYLKASNTGANDFFGYSVGISGDTVVVGAFGESSKATGVDGDQTDNSKGQAGAAYVFTRDASGTWSQQAYLKASNTDAQDQFGFSISVSGDTVVVGAPGESSLTSGVDGNQIDNSDPNAGAAYVFTRDTSGTWSQQAYLKASRTDAQDQFGFSISVSGDTVVVGAPNESSKATGVDGDGTDNSKSRAGAAYVFARDNSGTWSQQAYLKASNTDAGDQFGTSVAVSGDTLLVGAPGESSNATGVNGDQADNSAGNAGAAYVFTRDASGTWSQQAYLKASNTDTFDWFGSSIAISGDMVVVGANDETSKATGVDGDQTDNSVGSAGAAYLFSRDASGTWSQQAYLKASNTDAGDRFGWSAAVSGDTVAVSSYIEASKATGVDGDQTDNSAPNAGATYVY